MINLLCDRRRHSPSPRRGLGGRPWRLLRGAALSLALAAGAVFGLSQAAGAGAASALAAIEIVLPDGATWRGDVGDQVEVTFVEQGVRQTLAGELKKVEKLYITVEANIAGRVRDKVIFRSDISSLRSTDSGLTSANSGGGKTGPAKEPESASAKPAEPTRTADGKLVAPKKGVFVLPLEGTVGIGLRYQEMEAIAKEADKYGDGQTIVFIVDSPGGLVVEGDKIHDCLKEIKKRHRLVAWIKEAISGAAFTALHCDEIYFMRVGSLGAITMFAGQTAIQGEQLQAWLDKCGDVAEMGGRNRWVVQAMIHAPLLCSYDKDPVTGKVTFYNTLQGEYVLSDAKDNLVFNATNALHCGFSDGTADTVEELAQLLQLPEWYEISDVGRKLHRQWQDTVKLCQTEVPKLAARISFKGAAGGTEEKLSTEINLLREIMKWWDRCENVMKYELGVPPKDEIERLIRERSKVLADIRRAKRQQQSR